MIASHCPQYLIFQLHRVRISAQVLARLVAEYLGKCLAFEVRTVFDRDLLLEESKHG